MLLALYYCQWVQFVEPLRDGSGDALMRLDKLERERESDGLEAATWDRYNFGCKNDNITCALVSKKLFYMKTIAL